MTDDFVVLSGKQVSITSYLDVTSGTIDDVNPANNNLAATLTYDSGNIASIDNPSSITSLGGTVYEVTWQAEVNDSLTIAAGEDVSLEIENSEYNLGFKVLYDSSTYPSKIDFDTVSFIDISSLGVYDASGGGNLVNSIGNTDTVYVRVEVTDPFGDYDINELDLTITNPNSNQVENVTLTDGSLVNETPGDNTKTYEFAWQPGITGNNW